MKKCVLVCCCIFYFLFSFSSSSPPPPQQAMVARLWCCGVEDGACWTWSNPKFFSDARTPDHHILVLIIMRSRQAQSYIIYIPRYPLEKNYQRHRIAWNHPQRYHTPRFGFHGPMTGTDYCIALSGILLFTDGPPPSTFFSRGCVTTVGAKLTQRPAAFLHKSTKALFGKTKMYVIW